MTDWTQRIGPGKLCRLEAKYGDPVTAFEYFTMAIRNYLDSGNPTIRVSMAALAAFPTGSDVTNRPPPSPVSAVSARSREHWSKRAASRSPTYARSSATGPMSRLPERVKQ